MSQNKKAFIAGASGVIGKPLCAMLIQDGWKVYGTTRSDNKVELLKQMGVEPILVDVYDYDTLEKVLCDIKPDVLYHQLTDLPDGLNPEKMEEALVSNAKLRIEGTSNLVKASMQAGIKKMIAQSIAFVYEPGELPHTEESALLNFEDPVYGTTSKAVASLEEQVLNAPFIGIILRNGLFYGPETGFDEPVGFVPSVHVEAAAHAAILALECNTDSIYNVADEDERLSSEKINHELKWNSDFRLSLH